MYKSLRDQLALTLTLNFLPQYLQPMRIQFNEYKK